MPFWCCQGNGSTLMPRAGAKRGAFSKNPFAESRNNFSHVMVQPLPAGFIPKKCLCIIRELRPRIPCTFSTPRMVASCAKPQGQGAQETTRAWQFPGLRKMLWILSNLWENVSYLSKQMYNLYRAQPRKKFSHTSCARAAKPVCRRLPEPLGLLKGPC